MWNSYIQQGAFGVKGKSMRTLEEVKRLADGFRKLYDDARIFGVRDGRRVRADDTAGECYACLRNGYPCRKCVAASALDEKREKCKIESFGRDIALITAQYMEIEGQPYVLETVQLLPDGSIMEPDEGEYLLAKMTGYNTKLYHDALTGVYNRRYYEDIARNMSGPSGVAIMDLDDFKIHNDTYGHHGGDIALEVVADMVKENIRKCDSLIRFGGDEFLLILANIPEKTLKKKLEKIRDQVHAAVIHECPHLRVSVSIGGVVQGEHETMDSAVRRADRLLYHAKATKNEVVVESDNTLSESVQTKNCVKPLILIVDDCDMNREILREILSSDYSIVEACGGEEALSMIHQFGTGISLVLLDIVMPGLDGFEVLSYMNQDHTIEDIPVIMISSEDSEAFIRRAYEMGASDYVSRPFDAKVVYRRVTNNIKLYAKQRRLIRMVTEQIREREENVSMLVGVLSQIVEFRNGESGLHVKHIRRFTECILDCLIEKDPDLHLGTKERENIPLASALHDIGKIAVDDKILNKPGRLTPEEFEAMKLHTVYKV